MYKYIQNLSADNVRVNGLTAKSFQTDEFDVDKLKNFLDATIVTEDQIDIAKSVMNRVDISAPKMYAAFVDNSPDSLVNRQWIDDHVLHNFTGTDGQAVDVTAYELSQVGNINNTEILPGTWEKLATVNQPLSTTSDVQFKSIKIAEAVSNDNAVPKFYVDTYIENTKDDIDNRLDNVYVKLEINDIVSTLQPKNSNLYLIDQSLSTNATPLFKSILTVDAPSNANNLTSKSYVDDALSTKLNTSKAYSRSTIDSLLGGKLLVNDFNTFQTSNTSAVQSRALASDVYNKVQSDTLLSTKLDVSAFTTFQNSNTNNLNLKANTADVNMLLLAKQDVLGGTPSFMSVSATSAPSAVSHLTRKDYVDGLVVTAGTGLTKTGNVLSINASQSLTSLTVTGGGTFGGNLIFPSATMNTNLGIGTAPAASYRLHLCGASAANTNLVRLGMLNMGSVDPITTRIVYDCDGFGVNDISASMDFIRVNSGSNSQVALVFKTTTGGTLGTDYSVERMRIHPNGNVAINEHLTAKSIQTPMNTEENFLGGFRFLNTAGANYIQTHNTQGVNGNFHPILFSGLGGIGEKLRIDADFVSVPITTAATLPTSGAFRVYSGVGIGQNLIVSNSTSSKDFFSKQNTSGGGNGHYSLQTGSGVNRFALGLGNVESSGNIGSDFSLFSYADGGAFLGTPLSVTRSTGAVSIPGNLTVGGALIAPNLVTQNVSTGTLTDPYTAFHGLVPTYGSKDLTYTKTGALVSCNARITWSSATGSYTGGVCNLSLPFTVKDRDRFVDIKVQNAQSALTPVGGVNTPYVAFGAHKSLKFSLDSSAIGTASTELYITFSYFTNE